MQLLTFVSVTAILANTVAAQDYGTTTTAPAYLPTTGCETITTTRNPSECATKFDNCITLACLSLATITNHCGCTGIATTSTCPTACPTGCATSYMTLIEDCFPTATYTPMPIPSANPPGPGYGNGTKTSTSTTTLTTCPGSKICTGQTVTYTSTEICPSSTCVCVYPSVSLTTTRAPGETNPPVVTETTEVSPTGNMPTGPTATPPPIEANDAASWKWNVGLGMGVFGGVFVAAVGLL